MQRKTSIFVSKFEWFMKTPFWIWQYEGWPRFCWSNDNVIGTLAQVREKQGRLLGLMDSLGFDTQSISSLEVMTGVAQQRD